MTIEPNDFQSRLRVLLGLQGAVLTDEELSHTAERYPRCRGKEHWDVRQYVRRTDRKSTRLNSSHTVISYAVFCLKKKKEIDGLQSNSQYIEQNINNDARVGEKRIAV